MKISHEVPLSLLNKSREFNDYDYALVHLFETEPEYYDFYKRSIELKRQVILDNSVFELGTAFNQDKFKSWIEKLQPTFYIIPDVLDNADKTINNVKGWQKDVPGKTIGVVQGKTLDDAIRCYEEIKDLVDRVAISFNCKFYNGDSSPAGLRAWMSSRIQFMYKLIELENDKEVHLLGCSLPQEFMAYHNPRFNFIRSVDTSNPIVHALNGIKYTENGLKDKVSTKLIEYMHTKNFDMDLIKYNVHMFRTFCNAA